MFKKLSMLMLAAFALISAASAQQVILRGTIGNRTLDADTCYYLKGCVTVHNGTLTIQPGTRIFGIDTVIGASSYPGTLIIDTTGYIIANGTVTNPIIFTSGKAAGSRAPGDWGGIVIAGKSTANQNCDGSPFTIEGPCTPIYAGGNTPADSSGSMKYVQIHYAGRAVVANNELNSLTLCAVGSRTVIDHIQVTNALDDAFEFFGGTVNAKYLVAYNTLDDDFDTDFGYRGKIQYGFALRLDTSRHDISKSHGIESDNNNDGASDYTCGTYETRPIFSNFTLVGPLYNANNGCTPSYTLNSEFESAIQIRRNSSQNVYNSLITGWPQGLRIDDRNPNPVNPGIYPTIGNTAVTGVTNQLNFSYNTVFNIATDFISTPAAFTGGCGTMTAWLNGTGPAACREAGNEFPAGNIGGLRSLCGDFCATNPDFSLSSIHADLDGANFTPADLDNFFDDVTYRGAFGTTDWTDNWTNWCPNSTNYACGTTPSRPSADAEAKVLFMPNPTNGTTYAVFTTEQTGNVRIVILDKVTGKALRTANGQVSDAGQQKIAFNASGLHEGVYFVQVQLPNGKIISGQLSVY